MCKCICWLDDDIEKMLSVVYGIFPKLWNLGGKKETDYHIRNEIYIFGDGHKNNSGEYPRTITDEIVFQKKVNNYFFKQCENNSTSDWESANRLYAEKKNPLLDATVHVLPKEWSSIDDTIYCDKEDKEKEKKKRSREEKCFKEIYKFFTKKNKTINNDKYIRVKSYVEQFLKENKIIDEEIQPYVGIDLLLLYGDIERVKNGYTILSMELYSQIIKTHQCFLYSTYVYDEDFIEKWRETFRNNYDVEEPEKIYKRSMLLPKNGETSHVAEELVQHWSGTALQTDKSEKG